MAAIIKENAGQVITLSGKIVNKLLLKEKAQKTSIKEADWSSSYVNALPDDSFAHVQPGGGKDEMGKTTPRSLRKLPYKDDKGNIDEPHLRNALARLSQTNIPPQAKSAARKKLASAAKQVGIETSMDAAYDSLRVAIELSIADSLNDGYDSTPDPEQHEAEGDDTAKPGDSEAGETENQTIPPNTPKANQKKGDPAGQDTETDVPVERNVPDPVVNGPGSSSDSKQDFPDNAPKVKMNYVGVGNPDSTIKPDMDIDPNVNPLAVTNDKTAQAAPSLMSALQKATPNVTTKILKTSESKSSDLPIKIKVTVHK